MTRRTYTLLMPVTTAIALTVLAAGCGHQAPAADTLAQQKASVMGSMAPPDVRAKINGQIAAQKAAQQAGQQAGQQAAQQAGSQGQAPK